MFYSIVGLIGKRRASRAEPYESKPFADKSTKFSFKNDGKLGMILLIITVVVLIVGGGKLLGKISGTSQDGKIKVKGAKASYEINKEFSFPLRDGGGEEISRVKYMVERAELLDEIIVKGQRATAISGRTFLIFTLKITNEFKQPIEIETRDYVRLSVNANRQEWLAPEIHNDPVEVQAISTKYTRVGFPINETDKDLVLRVGEIDGQKEEIPIQFN